MSSPEVLRKYQPRNLLFPPHVDEKDCSQIVRGVNNHRQPDLLPPRIESPKHQARHRGLLDSRESLILVMRQGEQSGGDKNGREQGRATCAQERAQPLEQIPTKENLLTEGGVDQNRGNKQRQRGRVSHHEVIRLI